ncbi:hypothetical protein GCM10009650_05820 [Nesterenkonia jeotgali]
MPPLRRGPAAPLRRGPAAPLRRSPAALRHTGFAAQRAELTSVVQDSARRGRASTLRTRRLTSTARA